MRLKSSQVAVYRNQLIASNDGNCGLCHQPIERPCLDHRHGLSYGYCRDAICAKCNRALSQIENLARYGIRDNLSFIKKALDYLIKHDTDQTGVQHPTALTIDEKKARAKARAQRKRNKQ